MPSASSRCDSPRRRRALWTNLPKVCHMDQVGSEAAYFHPVLPILFGLWSGHYQWFPGSYQSSWVVDNLQPLRRRMQEVA